MENLEFGDDGMCNVLYNDNINDWREKYYTVHLLMRNDVIVHADMCGENPSITRFDEENVKTLNNTFGQMARLLLYNTLDLIF